MSTPVQFAITVVLALIALGVSAGQGFHLTGWVLAFWGLAAIVGLVGLVRHLLDRNSGGAASPPLSIREPVKPNSTMAIIERTIELFRLGGNDVGKKQ